VTSEFEILQFNDAHNHSVMSTSRH